MPRFIKKLGFVVPLTLTLWGSAFAGNITHLPGGMKCADLLNDGRRWCVFTLEIGTITPSTVQGIKKLVQYKSEFTEPIGGSVVVLNSLGGDLNSAYEIGQIIRERKYTAGIPVGARCVSACVFILAAASQRVIDGQVGIHRPFFASTSVANNSADKIQNDYGSAVDGMRDYLRQMNVDPRLADQMLRIDPDRVRYLTRAELDGFGIGEGAPSPDVEKLAKLKEAVAVKAANAYGLSRLEYMRRDDLIERMCQLGTL